MKEHNVYFRTCLVEAMGCLKIVVLLSALLIGVSCDNDIPIGDLPEVIITDLITTLGGGYLPPTNNCPEPQYSNISFLLYTRNNPDNPITLDPNNATQIDPTKKVIIVIHGWLTGPFYKIPEIKNAALQRYDCNLIIVDWWTYAFQPFPVSVCEVPKIAKLVGQFLCLIGQQLNILLSSVHVVGHSLGGQMAGYIGRYTNATCEAIGRITGLDPAGGTYQYLPIDEVLHKSDAIFVDIIHTNEKGFGICGNYGDADFHVNCGENQPGCPEVNLTDILNTALSVATCSHFRCVELYAESLNSDNLIAESCSQCPSKCTTDQDNPSYIIMGEDCPTNPPSSVYWIPTNTSSPYGEGCTPYPSGCS